MSYSLLAHFSAMADIRAALFFEIYGMPLNETKSSDNVPKDTLKSIEYTTLYYCILYTKYKIQN